VKDRTEKIFFARSDGRIEAAVRIACEDGIWREFVAGVSADPSEAAALAEALELRLWSALAGD
jgi:hypothetical protein